MFQVIFDSIGLYKVSVDSDWQQVCSGTSLMVFYYVVCFFIYFLFLFFS